VHTFLATTVYIGLTTITERLRDRERQQMHATLVQAPGSRGEYVPKPSTSETGTGFGRMSREKQGRFKTGTSSGTDAYIASKD